MPNARDVPGRRAEKADEAVCDSDCEIVPGITPRNEESRIIGRQVLRSGTSVAANYRAVCRARSKPEFIAKVGVVVEEIDETVFWLEMLTETGILQQAQTGSLMKEANELLAMFAASQRTARRNS